jgi:hypothetical protein
VFGEIVIVNKIGLDLDNTIIDYSQSYIKVAEYLNLPLTKRNRKDIKKILIESPTNDLAWQEFQSILYTEGLVHGVVSPGLIHFLRYCKLNKIEVFIVSHKTESTPKEFGSVDLRSPALRWLKDQEIVPDLIVLKNVLFCESRKTKIDLINKINCDIFVDDLEEILYDDHLSTNIRKILFSRDLKKNSISTFESLIELLQKNEF